MLQKFFFTENNTGNIYIDCNSLSLITVLRGEGQDNLATNPFHLRFPV